MAKISTYPADATPSLSDMVIGTDVNDANNTKNYSIGSILGLANLGNYVPYTGAVQDVNLGTRSLIFAGGKLLVNNFGSIGIELNSGSSIALGSSLEGSYGQIAMSNGPGLSPTWEDVSVLTNHGQFFSTLNPTFAANTPTAIQLNNTDTATTSGISIVSNSQITFSKTGQYKISYSCNLQVGASGNNHYMVLFLRKNGTGSGSTGNINNTTHRYLTTGNSYTIRISGENLVDVTAGDYIELMCAMTSTNLSLTFIPATLVAPIAPLEPSTLVTVTQI